MTRGITWSAARGYRRSKYTDVIKTLDENIRITIVKFVYDFNSNFTLNQLTYQLVNATRLKGL